MTLKRGERGRRWDDQLATLKQIQENSNTLPPRVSTPDHRQPTAAVTAVAYLHSQQFCTPGTQTRTHAIMDVMSRLWLDSGLIRGEITNKRPSDRLAVPASPAAAAQLKNQGTIRVPLLCGHPCIFGD